MTAQQSERVHPNITLAVLAVGALAYAVLSAAVVPALPTIQHDLHTSETGVTWLLTAYLLAASVGTSILGRLGDMYGKGRVLLWTFVILALGTLLAAVANSLALVIVGRALQGAAGGIFPLAFGIVRDEFPREKVAGSIGLLSATLGVGGGLGIVGSGVILQHLSWHWLFWIPLFVIVVAALFTWRFVPESPVRVPGRINWGAAALMTVGISAALLAVSEATVWSWGSVKTLGPARGGTRGVRGLGRRRGTQQRAAGGHDDDANPRCLDRPTSPHSCSAPGCTPRSSSSPSSRSCPTSTGFGFGSSVVVSGLYLLPLTIAMMTMSLLAGPLALRYGSRLSLLVGTVVTAAAFALLALAHGHPYDFLISAGLMGIGIGLAFAALGNLIVEAVPPHQTGVASGMNTVMRTLGGALGAQIAATFIAANVAHGLPTVTGFTESFVLATAFLVVGILAAVAVPRRRVSRETPAPDAQHERPALGGHGDRPAETANPRA